MSNIFFASDHHFGHTNILSFLVEGRQLRTFEDVTHMNEFMVMQHNRVVCPKDKVYFLGDVAMGSAGLVHLDRMNGEKILIRGNHDKDKLSNYAKYFKDVRGVHQFDKMILSHIPLHPDSLGRWGHNVHGHLHSHKVMLSEHHPDPRYICVCMEQLDNYMPISLEDIKKQMV